MEAHQFLANARFPEECTVCGFGGEAGIHHGVEWLSPPATAAKKPELVGLVGDLNTRAVLECEKWRALASAAVATLMLVDRGLARWEEARADWRQEFTLTWRGLETDPEVLRERVRMVLAAAELAGVEIPGRESAGEARHG